MGTTQNKVGKEAAHSIRRFQGCPAAIDLPPQGHLLF